MASYFLDIGDKYHLNALAQSFQVGSLPSAKVRIYLYDIFNLRTYFFLLKVHFFVHFLLGYGLSDNCILLVNQHLSHTKYYLLYQT
jgi:hypothetical protein